MGGQLVGSHPLDALCETVRGEADGWLVGSWCAWASPARQQCVVGLRAPAAVGARAVLRPSADRSPYSGGCQH